ncbi:MAG: YlxM family DNA-binding protein [Clostridiales bacterium]|nr:YlxM family DNA-binding protein [Clostridiales bacterium]
MEKIFLVTMLYDFYGELLTSKQKAAFEKHYLEDLSFNEIGAEQGTTRQAVMDMVKRSEKLLSQYEEKLHLVDKFTSRKEKVKQIQKELGKLPKDDFIVSERICLIEKMLSEILD